MAGGVEGKAEAERTKRMGNTKQTKVKRKPNTKKSEGPSKCHPGVVGGN